MCSFTDTGIPCSKPSGSPSRTAASAFFAWARGPFLIDMAESLERFLMLLDTVEEVVGHLDRRHVALDDQLPNLPSRHPCQLVTHQ